MKRHIDFFLLRFTAKPHLAGNVVWLLMRIRDTSQIARMVNQAAETQLSTASASAPYLLLHVDLHVDCRACASFLRQEVGARLNVCLARILLVAARVPQQS